MTRVKKPCAHCPFRTDVKPFLHPERAADIAYSAGNRYSDFRCHKTVDYSHVDDEGEGRVTAKSRTCAGFFAMQINYGGRQEPAGYVWPDNTYSEPGEMVEAYEAEWNRSRRRVSAA